ncbi:RHS repeat domain-containing protein [Riemerella anatipestifer]|uniref:RHS repeat domain-containing protein n=1 Tax=Riemerella anatipestifer TaxID=34085 RepID=UPI003DA826AD
MATLNTQNTKRTFQDNRYTYDLVGNILQVENQVPIVNYALGGASNYQYQYDELNRLIRATGTYTGEATSAEYQLQMQYNKLNGIVQKSLTHKQNGKDKGYTLDYTYNNPKHPHALSILKDTTTPKPRTYEYDGNGNPISYEGFKDFRVMVWDEENRLQGLNDNGKLHLYTYDHTGERAVKSSAESQKTVINGVSSAVIVHAENYTAYVNPYFVVNKGKFTKHYFEGTSRIVSKLGEGTFHQPSGLMAGGIDYIKQSAKIQEAIDQYIKGLNIPPGPPTQHGIYGTPDFTGVEYPSIDWSDISQDQEPPEGWPRPPKFNEPGDVPGPPVQYGDPVKPETVEGGFGFKDNGVEEKNLYYYHPDHLGSSSYITDANGDVNQHTEYMAFGEVLFDEHKVSRRMPYLFNGKELDSETGLYYYGARYYDARVSLWLGTDPLSGYNPIMETEHYIDGQHNGGVFNPMNGATYSYTYQNPVVFIDPNGKQTYSSTIIGTILKPYNSDYYRFRESAAYLLSKTSGVSFEKIKAGRIIKSNPEVFNIPFYSSGSITLPLGGKKNIISTKNFFKSGYNRLIGYLEHMAHEVKHFDHIDAHNADLEKYITEFSKQYIKAGSHDGAKYERQADFGEYVMGGFVDFTDRYYGKNELAKIFENKSNTEKDVMGRIDQWWGNFQKSPEYKKALVDYYKERVDKSEK